MSEDALPEPDRAEGAPHPRETTRLIGQTEAEATFLQSYTSGRLHHAWLLTGPRGVGKATLAWRMARFLLTQPEDQSGGMFGEPEKPASLDCNFDHPVAKRMQALGEPRLYLCRRPWDDKSKRLKRDITVEEIRKLKSFFTLSAADGGWRVAIIDAADDLNRSAENALLKILEEPPEKVLILLVSHQPSKLLPTIRSRCRALRCAALSDKDQAEILAQCGLDVAAQAGPLSVLSNGSVGEAIRLMNTDGVVLYDRLVALVVTAPSLNRDAAVNLANKCSGRDAALLYEMTVHLCLLLLSRLARYGALQPSVWTEAAQGEALMLAKLAPNPAAGRKWANLAQEISGRVTHARAVNLDPSSVILDMLLKLDETAQA